MSVMLVLAMTGWAWGDVAPVMEDHSLMTYAQQPVTFELRADDPNIDPTVPEGHPLVFSLVDGPSHGVLLVDFHQVVYRIPHQAAVTVVYVPADGFIGTDVMTFRVTDPAGETAMATTTIDVVRRLSIGILSGAWSTRLTYNAQTQSITALQTQLTGVFRVERLTLKGIADIRMTSDGVSKEAVFDSLRFQADAALPGISHTSKLFFDPNAPAQFFDRWEASTRFALGPVGFSHTLVFRHGLLDSYQALLAEASLGPAHVSNMLRLALNLDCGFTFSRNDLTISWTWCDLLLRAAFRMACSGFDSFRLQASGIPVPIHAVLGGDVYVDASLTFTSTGKEFSAELVWSPRPGACIQLQTESFDSVDPKVLRIQCDIPSDYGAVRFVWASSSDDGFNVQATGQSDYSDVLRLSGPLQSCCSAPGAWSIATYFHDDSTNLFDWGMTVLHADVRVAPPFDVFFETVFRSGFFGDPTLELTVGWTTRW